MNLANLAGFEPEMKKADSFTLMTRIEQLNQWQIWELNVIYNKGNLQVQKGQINHFSRYGFIRGAD